MLPTPTKPTVLGNAAALDIARRAVQRSSGGVAAAAAVAARPPRRKLLRRGMLAGSVGAAALRSGTLVTAVVAAPRLGKSPQAQKHDARAQKEIEYSRRSYFTFVWFSDLRAVFL